MFLPLPRLFFIAPLFLALSLSGQSLEALIQQLDTKSYADAYALRVEILKTFASTFGDSDAPTVEALEQIVIEQLPEVSNPKAKIYLLRVLQWFGSEASVPVLAVYLKSTNKDLQETARRALMANPSDQAAHILAQSLFQATDLNKGPFLDAFVYRDDKRSIKAIEAYMQSDTPGLVAEATQALIQLGEEDAMDWVVDAYKRSGAENKNLLQRAQVLLGADAGTCERLIREGVDSGVVMAAYRRLLSLDQSAAEEMLQLFLGEPGSHLRSKLLRVSFESESLRDSCIAHLANSSAADQKLILQAITEHALSAYEDAVLSLLAVSDKEVKREAIRTLGVVGGVASYDSLFTLFMEDADKDAEEALAMLTLPSLNERLFQLLEHGEDPDKRTAAVRLLARRNAQGAAEIFTQRIQPGSSEVLRRECIRALESLGTLQTCQTFAGFIIEEDPLKRDVQRSLKRLCLNYGDPDLLWAEVFMPALNAAPSDDLRRDLLAIADGVAGEALLSYIRTQIEDKDSSLRSASMKILSRWPDLYAGELWIQVATDPEASPSDLTAAQAGLTRIVKNKKVIGWEKLKLELIVKALKSAPNDTFKRAMITCYLEPSSYIQHYLHDAFQPYLNDPVVAQEVAAVLATIPELKERRKL